MAINNNIGLGGSGFRNPLDPGVLGCTDRFANNYNPKANISCDTPKYINVECCKYDKVKNPISALISEVKFLDEPNGRPTQYLDDPIDVPTPTGGGSYPYDISTTNSSCYLEGFSSNDFQVRLKGLYVDYQSVGGAPNWGVEGSVNDLVDAFTIISGLKPDYGVYYNTPDFIPWVIPTYTNYTPLTTNQENINRLKSDCKRVGGEFFSYQPNTKSSELDDKVRLETEVKELESLEDDIKKTKGELDNLEKRVAEKQKGDGKVSSNDSDAISKVREKLKDLNKSKGSTEDLISSVEAKAKEAKESKSVSYVGSFKACLCQESDNIDDDDDDDIIIGDDDGDDDDIDIDIDDDDDDDIDIDIDDDDDDDDIIIGDDDGDDDDDIIIGDDDGDGDGDDDDIIIGDDGTGGNGGGTGGTGGTGGNGGTGGTGGNGGGTGKSEKNECPKLSNLKVGTREGEVRNEKGEWEVGKIPYIVNPVSEDCCNNTSLGVTGNGRWSWSGSDCIYSEEPSSTSCDTNSIITISETPINLKGTECSGGVITLSTYIYFEEPGNQCTDGVLFDSLDNTDIDEEYIDLYNNQPENSEEISLFSEGVDGSVVSYRFNPTTEQSQDKSCCYDTSNPIDGRLIVQDKNNNKVGSTSIEYIDTFNSTVTDLNLNTSNGQGFNQWVKLTTVVKLNSLNLDTIKLGVEFTDGLFKCCNYNVFFDDIQVNCEQTLGRELTYEEGCVGFELSKPIIDNKKSWVYNPGLSGMTDNVYDNMVRDNGVKGMNIQDSRIVSIGGHGDVNRVFAPSVDADLEFRDTDYYNFHSVVEKHSKLVLNSKELTLQFNMCAFGTQGLCPRGYTYSQFSNKCEREELSCPVGFFVKDGVCVKETTSTTCRTDIDFTQMFYDEVDSCGCTTECDITTKWGIDVILNSNETIYSKDDFFEGVGTSVPTQSDYVTELTGVANNLNLDVSFEDNMVTFTENIYCKSLFYGGTFEVKLNLIIEAVCPITKEFQDNINFRFQDDEDFDFN